MPDEKELIRKRGSFKARLTIFGNYLENLGPSSLTSSQASELKLRIGKVETLYDQYDEVQIQLECLVDDIDLQVKDRIEFESLYYKLLSKAQDALCSYEQDKSATCSEAGSARTNNNKLVKLPTIQLPKFSGSYENWLEFHDTFLSLIHSNDQIDEINKFHYLRASLEGTAALVIQSIEFSANNYTVAWGLLCERFDNKRLLVQNHVSALFNLDAITKESSVALKRLLDQVNKNLRSLKSLGEPTLHWDTLLIYMITHKLDPKTFREWEEVKGSLDKDKPITITAFLDFIRRRADLIETLELSRNPASNQTGSCSKSIPKLKAMVSVQDGSGSSSVSPTKPCPHCDGNHHLNNCSNFLALSNSKRLQLLANYKVCYNCFRPNHYANHCKKPGCKICKRKHNTLIHVAETTPKLAASSPVQSRAHDVSAPVDSQSPTAADSSANLALSASITASSQRDVLLSTALVKLYDANNHEHIARAVLDSGSTSCLMTEAMCRRLNLPVESVNKTIQGVNNATYRIGKRCNATMKSLNDNFSLGLQCFVLPTITDNVPCRQVDISNLNIPSDLCLADPNFYVPADVDLLLGADVFWDLLGSQHIKLGVGKPILHESRLGWLLAGPINSGHGSTPSHSQPIKCNFTQLDSPSTDDIQNQLARFWQLDEVCPKSSDYSPEEQSCENHFVKTITRLDDGRFCARIPLKDSPEVLGDSYQRAKHCFLSLERRNQSRPLFQKMYREFMAEYRDLGHMTECQSMPFHENAYFIPHHGVLSNSSTTKLRTVFNASSPTSTGVSLNNIQMVGPTVQDDLLSILIRFRQHKYVLAADVEKMYRQVAIHPDDRHLQQIVWRDEPSEPLKVYQLNTVTYGTASAPFIATRCLKQISLECVDDNIAEIIAHDFYVDDLLTGGDNLGKVDNIRNKVTAALASACMPLRKWKSNDSRLVPESLGGAVDLNIGDAEPSKTLGLGWQTKTDELCFSISPVVATDDTKRGMLSVIAQIFDPLGLLAPCVVRLKMLMQHLWLKKLSWDEQLPPEILKTWTELSKNLLALNELRIPRHVVCDSSKVLDLHIFTDSSQNAYGACVYVSSRDNIGEPLVRLLLAKSRVCPIKPTTIPRLELCGALVGVRLYEKVIGSLRARVDSVTFWTDSMIVLGWLKMLPSRLQLFVRTRTAEINEKTSHHTWRHVPTNQNPADLISRGVDARLIRDLDLWWSGPAFLKQDSSMWPAIPGSSVALPEVRPDVSLHVKEVEDNPVIDFERFSNVSKLKRAVAYMLRFIAACRKQAATTKHLNADELNRAMILLIRTSQQESFPEYKQLLAKQSLPKKSPLLKFNVFLDDNNLIRVGGRLENSTFSYEKKHPILLQSTHRLTKLIFQFEHRQLMHAGPQLLLATIRELYWPIGGRSLAKACYRHCITCSRMRGQVVAPIMGNLPGQRLLPGGNPFESVGVDYAGPMLSASRQGRGCRLVKVYIAIFVCFTTKAIHLELVGDLTSNCYLLALRRFISRRGRPINIYSDNGTSFVGAYNDLSKFLKSSSDSLSETFSNEGINFHFIPAYSPHFGGLHEAGVKSTKYHLKRVLGDCKLTYEELNTLLVQIEAILNSRPITPLTSDANDMMPLTPGHFLVGRPLTSLPTPNYEDHSTHYLTRFQRIEQLRQHFWTRWSKEYVSELQLRTKWRTGESTLRMGSLVLIKDDNLPPLKWRLGRITAIFPGTDGIVRVAEVKTSTGSCRRAFSKICPLPEGDFC